MYCIVNRNFQHPLFFPIHEQIYNSVMPEWLDLLVQLRTETGKMAILRTHYHRLVTHPHPDGMEMIEFVWNKFRAKAASGTEMQKALFWLQVRKLRNMGVKY